MPRRGLTTEWSIELDDSFRSRVVQDSLQFLCAGPPVRTIWLSVWNAPAEDAPATTLEKILQDVHPDPVERFREQDDDEVRYASWYPEAVQGRNQWGLYGYTVRPGSYVQIALITDDEHDHDWALEAWRSLRFQPAG